MATSPGDLSNEPYVLPHQSIPPKPPSPSLLEQLRKSPGKAKNKLTAFLTGSGGKNETPKVVQGARQHPYSAEARENRSRASVASNTSTTSDNLSGQHQLETQTAKAFDVESDDYTEADEIDGDPTVRLDSLARPMTSDDVFSQNGEHELEQNADAVKARLLETSSAAVDCLRALERLDAAGHPTAAQLGPDTTANIQFLASSLGVAPQTTLQALDNALKQNFAVIADILNGIKGDVATFKKETTLKLDTMRQDTNTRLDKMQQDTTTRLDVLEKTRHDNAAPPASRPDPKSSFATGPLYKPASKTPPTAQMAPRPAPANQTKAHHPSRLIIDTSKLDAAATRPDADKLATDINAALQKDETAKHIVVVNVKWNKKGNGVITVLDGQTGTELAAHAKLFTHLFAPSPEALTIREDKRWYKIQVNGVRTGTQDNVSRSIYTPETLDAELRTKNPVYAQMPIIQLPHFTRSPQELATAPYSSIVFATDDEAAFKILINDYKKL